MFSATCVALLIMFVACKDDDDKVNAPDSLVGTSWLYESDETETVDDVEISTATFVYWNFFW
jgi:hypothetical protein